MIPKLMLRAARFPRTGMLAALFVFAAGGSAAADLAKGAQLYTMHCAMCHGANGTPVMPNTPNFRRMDSLMRPDMQLMQSIKTGKGMMPGFFGILRDREILDVVAYLRTLS